MVKIRQSPIPGWAWDLIEQVERGERQTGLVREIRWRTKRGGIYDRMIADAKAGHIRATPEHLDKAVQGWIERRDERGRWSHGWARGGVGAFWRIGTISITCGTDPEDARMVVLHEMAHLLTPLWSHHNKEWQRNAARLYRKYGGPLIVAHAIENERYALLQRRLAKEYPSE
jgi:hypothetical protein